MDTANCLSGIGPHENGCHTDEGCELALYAQTTRSLHEHRQRIFDDILKAKRKWKGMSEFNALLQLDKRGRQLAHEAESMYAREILRGKSYLKLGERGLQDFVLWLAREFDDHVIDMEIKGRSAA